jgi:hypothetical protein
METLKVARIELKQLSKLKSKWVKTGIDKELHFKYYNRDVHRKPKSDMWKYEKRATLC